MSGDETGPGAKLVADRYRLVRELGRGGMGVVWLADDQLVGRPVAVKELRPSAGLSAAERETYQQRALAEARSAARIQHTGAVTLYDVLPSSDGDDAVYLIMELIEGQTLADLVSQYGRVPDATVAWFGTQLVSVLQAAHALGIVHRDVKPSNIMITADGNVKLTDFGIAHTLGDTRLTRSGVMGTQAYLAPELFDAAPITPAADVWSLGATLFAAVTGRGPFDRETTGATLRAILIDALPAPQCSPALAAALSGMLQRDPARRAAVAQAGAQLEAAAQAAAQAPAPPQHLLSRTPGPPAPWELAKTTRTPPGPEVQPPQPAPGPAPGPPPGTRYRTAVIAGGIAAAILAAAGITAGILVTRHSTGPGDQAGQHSPAAATRAPIATMTDPPGNEAGIVQCVVFSPDGKTLATADHHGSTFLWDTGSQDREASLADPGSKGVLSAAFSPDGKTLATGDANGSTYLWNTASHTITATLTDPHGAGIASAAFSPDGQTLATGEANGGTYLWNTASHTITATLTDPPDPDSGISGVESVAFSPDGKTLATGDQGGSAYLWNTATRSITATLVPPHRLDAVAVAFSPDGQTLATADLAGRAYLWNIASRSITATLADPRSAGLDSVAFSPDGKTLATGDENARAYLWDTATHRLILTLSNVDTIELDSVAFSPDGQLLAGGEGSGVTDLWRTGGSG